jgi:hypothetical protein
VAVPDQPVSITGQRQEVIITFLEPVHTAKIDATAKDERIAMAKSLFGILPSSIRDDEIRAERLKRYESTT